MPKEWLTTSEAAEVSGYSVQYLRRLMREGAIKAQKFGPVWQISRIGLTEYLKTAEKSEDPRHGPRK